MDRNCRREQRAKNGRMLRRKRSRKSATIPNEYAGNAALGGAKCGEMTSGKNGVGSGGSEKNCLRGVDLSGLSAMITPVADKKRSVSRADGKQEKEKSLLRDKREVDITTLPARKRRGESRSKEKLGAKRVEKKEKDPLDKSRCFEGYSKHCDQQTPKANARGTNPWRDSLVL